MRRRTFLGGIVKGALALGLPRRAAAEGRRVVVVGGGPAGLSAALELAERGVAVTLVEAGSQLGGKAKGWTDTLDGEPVDVEHGIHGWWHQYVHFHDLLDRYVLADGLGRARRRVNGLRMADGFRVRSVFSRAAAFAAAGEAKGYGFFPREFGLGRRWIRHIDTAFIRHTWSGRSVADFVRSHPPLTVYGTFDRLMSWSMYFRGPEDVDAATLIEGERFYFSGDTHNHRVQWLKGNPQHLVWEPLGHALRAAGAQIRLGAPVSSLVVEEGVVRGVRLGQPAARVAVGDAPEGWSVVDGPRGRIHVHRDAEAVRAFSARCTHQGCPVDRVDGGFSCPCHGGRYDDAGVPVAGPPEAPLVGLAVDGDTLVLPDTTEVLDADHVILAVDVPAAQALAGELVPSLHRLRACPETVARFWLDTDVDAGARASVLLDGFPHANNGFLVHRLQRSAGDWAAKTGGSVIELQAYRGLDDLPPEARLERLEADLRAIWPELKEATVLRTHLTVGDAFTWFHPGWRDSAPKPEPGVEGLLFAGDWLDLERECQFMEAAVYSGRLAANVVLGAAGLAPARILPARR